MKNMKNYNFTYLKPVAKNPCFQEAKDHTEEWLTNFGILNSDDVDLREKVNKAKFSDMTAYFWPQADLEQLKLLNDWVYWLFIFDDILEVSSPDDVEKAGQKIIDIMGGAKHELSTDPFINSYQDWWTRFQEMTSEGCQKRIIKGYNDFFDSCHQAAIYKIQSKTHSLEDYIPFRRSNVAAFVTFALSEVVDKTPEWVFEDKRVPVLLELAADSFSLVNDFHSVDKERAEGAIENYILLLEKEKKDLTEEEAKDYTFDKIEKNTAEIKKIYQQIKSEPNKEELRSYLEGIIDMLVGNIEWGYNTKRYVVADNSEKELMVSSEQNVQKTAQVLQEKH